MRADSQEQMSSQQSGVSTGAAYAPSYDALHRPITAGGFIDQGPIATSRSGLPSPLRSTKRDTSPPNGAMQKFTVPAVDRIYTVEEGKGITASFCPACSVTKGPDAK